MKELIQQKLKGLESDYNITILFAVESGSRAWGFPSPDSDYDVRFIYKHMPEWYLSLDEQKDTINSLEGELDLVGWDVRKALRLLRKSNAALFEKLQSPIRYGQQGCFLEEIQRLAPAYFSPMAGLHHYLSMAFNYYKASAPEQDVKLKSYFYLLRTTLASLWIVENGTIPPMEFKELLPLVQDRKQLDKVEQLLEVKTQEGEQYRHPKEVELETYLLQILNYCESKADSLPKSVGTTQTLDQLFRTTILEYDTNHS
ncbi:nucleotidyltransferase domain-containing protein [Rufibacter aurantiacus]|uniref:nucleotidyltransferase domain-containing protein n=1 Tax=Rufibacter aurantiacus TaxID=2817374 RepID=UPI001B30C706|nr:nucleotidyltransferase domain-containing protein [Rufibacter aurantiacus]